MDVGARRSGITKAGIALIPPSQNKMSTDLIGILRKAENEIFEIKDGQEKQRIQESVNRRIAAVEEVKRKRADEEECAKQLKLQAEMEAKKIMQDAAEEEENAKQLKIQATLDAKKIIDDAETKANEIRTNATSCTVSKRKPMSFESLEKRRQTFAERKQKIAKFDDLVHENEALKNLLSRFVEPDELESMIQKSVFEIL
tara:strand:+ start:98 stop:697 length:600 start_codon:yes stop_codon:yes gene_type:complete